MLVDSLSLKGDPVHELKQYPSAPFMWRAIGVSAMVPGTSSKQGFYDCDVSSAAQSSWGLPPTTIEWGWTFSLLPKLYSGRKLIAKLRMII